MRIGREYIGPNLVLIFIIFNPPTFVFGVCFQGVMKGVRILLAMPLESISEDEVWSMVDGVLFSLVLFLLGILCVACFSIDSAPPTSWTIYNVRDSLASHPIIRDVAACGLALVHLLLIEFVGLHPGILLWHFSCIVTVLLPSFVARVMEGASGADGSSSEIRPRAKAVVVFGLRYGFLVGCFGIQRAASAVVLVRLFTQMYGEEYGTVDNRWHEYVSSEETECFLSQLKPYVLFHCVSLMVAVRILKVNHCTYGDIFPPDTMYGLLYAILGLLYVNALVFTLQKVGSVLGGKVLKSVPPNQGVSSSEIKLCPDLTGSTVLACCSFLLLSVFIS